MKDNNTVQRDERSLEHGSEKVKITHIPDIKISRRPANLSV